MIFYNQKKTFLLLSLFFTVAYTGLLVDQAIAQNPTAELRCDRSNYKQYIFDVQKTTKLISQTGQGCQLAGMDLSQADLSKGRISKGRIS